MKSPRKRLQTSSSERPRPERRRRATPSPLVQALDAMAHVQGVLVSGSAFADRDAYWVDGHEIAHEKDGLIDMRLGRARIRELRERLEADPRVTLRRSTSDWMEICVRQASDVPWALELFGWAVAAHRPSGTAASRTPPTGTDLARRRRFH